MNNGIYNLNTGQLEAFRPEIIVKNKIPFNYNYDAYNETMDVMLDRVSCYDDSIRDLLEEVAGYCFYRRNELRKAFIFIGDKANGKSTYLDCLSYMVGTENRTALDLKELGDRFRTAELYGKLICAGDDIGDEFIANPAIFKKVVSGDPIVIERKGQDPFTLYNYSKPIFSANNIPRIKDKTGAVLDRLVIVPFNATFSKTDADYDPYIKYKLRSSEAMEYLIQLSLDGLKRVLDNNGFTICAKVQEEIDEYNEQNNPIVGFFKELEKYADDPEVRRAFAEIKHIKKVQLSEYVLKREGVELPPHFIFDVQAKRLHEYKRQLMNAFSILYYYFSIKEVKEPNFKPMAFIFGAKAAPAYWNAKGIIKFINAIADKVTGSPY